MSEPTKTDDHALIEAAQAGDRQALESLIEHYQSHVFRFGMKMCGDPQDAEDVLQETMLAMARTVSNFRGASSVSTWLYSIARSFCIKKRRRSKFAPSAEVSLEVDGRGEARQVATSSPDPEDLASARQMQQLLERAIAALEPSYREVLLLRDVEGLTAKEVGEVLNLSVAAVKSRLHRARSSVRRDLAGALDEPGDTCPDVVDLFSRHLEGDISADLCAEMEQHIDKCGRCHGACDSLRQTLALCQAAPAPEVPESVKNSIKVAMQDLLLSRK